MTELKSQTEPIDELMKMFSLHRGEENKSEVLKNVRKGITFTGSNAWILACAIIIASVGLNVGSTAVIIGAMLISPLMGPIVGAGFALGTYDFDLFKKSLVNLGIATVISLFFSFLYFLISPIDTQNSEILSRTSPSLFDVIIAFFGGLVGAIAITHVEKGNVIPGVAIATALMPPICVSGFSLATGNWNYLFGSFFLYCINCVFICVSTYVIVKYLDYPKKEQLDTKKTKEIQRYITILTLLMIIPSVYFAYQLYQKEQFHQEANDYISKEFNSMDVLKVSTNYGTKTIEVVPLYKNYSKEDIAKKQADLKNYGLENATLIIKTDTTDLKTDILNSLGDQKEAMSEKDVLIQKLKNQIASNSYDNVDVMKEAKVLFPGIENIAIANHGFDEKDTIMNVPVVVYIAKRPLDNAKEKQLQEWLEQKIKHDTLLVFYQKAN